jgi:hypothetical protein
MNFFKPKRRREIWPSICWLLLFLSCANWCPAQTAQTKGTVPKNGVRKLTPEKERGLRLLKAAEAEAPSLDPDMRAFALWRISYAYTMIDSKKAERLARDAFTAAVAIHDAPFPRCGPAGDIKSWIEEHILSGMIGKGKLTEAAALLSTATASVRTHIVTELVRRYAGEKKFAQAELLLSQITDAEQYPFGAAADLLLAIGPEQAADRINVFSQALNNFERHASSANLSRRHR